MCAPVIAAVAVIRADVGIAGVGQIAAILHADLQALSHVYVGHIGGRLTHPDTLTWERHKEKVRSRKKKTQYVSSKNRIPDLYAANKSLADMVSFSGQTTNIKSLQLQPWEVITNLH